MNRMGCIPSKKTVLEADGIAGPARIQTQTPRPKKEKKMKRGLESPIIGDDAPPWVTGHRVLSEKDGALIISERPS